MQNEIYEIGAKIAERKPEFCAKLLKLPTISQMRLHWNCYLVAVISN